MVYRTSEERKIFSEEIMARKKIDFNPHLPLVEDSKEARFQSARDVAIRTQILGGLVETTFDMTRSDCLDYFKHIKILKYVSPTEREYLESEKPEKQSAIDMSWRVEANYILFWSLGYVEKLSEPIQPIDLHEIHEEIGNKFKSAEQFFSSASLRDKEEILDECDLIYRIHNAVRNSLFSNKKIPNSYHPSIVYERHYALNWLTCYHDEWDEITTDT